MVGSFFAAIKVTHKGAIVNTQILALTKEGSGEVLEWRVSNLSLAPSFVGSVDKCGWSLDTAAERTRPTRDERRKALKIKHRTRSPRVAAVFWRRIEGRLARESTVSVRRGVHCPSTLARHGLLFSGRTDSAAANLRAVRPFTPQTATPTCAVGGIHLIDGPARGREQRRAVFICRRTCKGAWTWALSQKINSS